MDFGLIGYPLKHSFSKEIHSLISNYDYTILELDDKSFERFMVEKKFKGINVTIPYKKKVIPYLDYIDKTAKDINAVNTIVNDNGKLKGYNTDILGVLATFENFNINVKNKNILILGTGATSNTVYHAIKKASDNDDVSSTSKIYKVYRSESKVKGDILYSELDKISDDINIIINTTSNGMYPHADDDMLVDIHKFKKLEAVIDVIYNPLRTNLMLEVNKNNIKSISGLYMLVSQAVFASAIFNNNQVSFEINNNNIYEDNVFTLINNAKVLCNDIYNKILALKINIVLTGMPTCGKTTIGKMISEKYGYDFIDTDALIERKVNKKISDFIKKCGEEKFRSIESDVIKEVSSKNHQVIATGGGAILKDINITNLKSNGKIFFINRSLSLLKPSSDRPLTSDIISLTKKYNERLPIYKSTCDVEINGDDEFETKIQNILNNLC